MTNVPCGGSGDSLTIELVRQDIKRGTSESYKGFVVISRLKSVPNEAKKCNAFAYEEEVRRFGFRYIELVRSTDGHMRQSNRRMPEAFQAHFRHRLVRCPLLLVQEFRSYLADFPRLQEVEAASCEDLVTEWLPYMCLF